MAESPYIRRYLPADHPALLSFLEQTFLALGRRFVPDGKDADIRDIDQVYLENRGSFFVAVMDARSEIHGCVGVRQLSTEFCELKRLYLAPEYRGLGIGRALCDHAIADARRLGYRFLRLDTTADSRAALALFNKLGFCEIPRYNSDPFAEIFMEKAL